MTAVLEVKSVSVEFGGLQALREVDLEVNEGSIVGLIGPNGAGKTTLIDAISGLVSYRGRIELDGHDLAGSAPHVRSRRGFSRTWQSIELFGDLTIAENLAVAMHPPSLGTRLRRRRSRTAVTTAHVERTLALVNLASVKDAMPSQLSDGQRKLAGVARAVVAQPRLLCLDEPAAGLNSSESLELGMRLREIAQHGISMLLVDHDMGLVLRTCDHVVVLEFGEVIASGRPDIVRREPRVIQAYLGHAASKLDEDELVGVNARAKRGFPCRRPV